MPTPSTKDRLIDSALRLFYRGGFRNVGLDQVLADVGISKTAFYKHYDCKEDLVLAALENQHQRLQERLATLVEQFGGSDPVAQLHALFDVVESIVDSDDFQGCIFVNVSMEFPLPHEPAHQAAARSKREIEDFVTSLATRAGAADPRALAQELCMIMEGSYVRSHVTGDPETLTIARRLAGRAIAAHCSAGSPR